MHDFATISVLPVNVTLPGTVGVDFSDSTQPVSFTITVGGTQSNQVTIKAPVGELIRAVTMPEPLFISEQSEYCKAEHVMAFDYNCV
jgi:AP-3 complex subunit beta